MIVGKIMDWLFPNRAHCDAERRLDATISASLLANAKVAQAAADVNEAAEISQALMENVTFDASRRALASHERRVRRAKGTEAAMRGMLSEVNRGKASDERH
jgi:hypothetical protein